MYRFVFDYGLRWLKAFVCRRCCRRCHPLVLVQFIIYVKIVERRHRTHDKTPTKNEKKTNNNKKQINLMDAKKKNWSETAPADVELIALYLCVRIVAAVVAGK